MQEVLSDNGLEKQTFLNGIREATFDDLPEMVRINLECRKHNYKGYLPQDYLDGLSIESTLLKREEHFLEEKDRATYVKVIDGKIVGFINGGKNTDIEYPYENEIENLYIDIKYQGMQIGKELFDKLMEDEQFKNCKSFYLYTIKGNPQTSNFYKKMGGKEIENFSHRPLNLGDASLEGYVRER